MTLSEPPELIARVLPAPATRRFLPASRVRLAPSGLAVSLAPNLRRDRVAYVGALKHPLRFREAEGPWQARTPAMAAGLSDHLWSTKEWITYPARPR